MYGCYCNRVSEYTDPQRYMDESTGNILTIANQSDLTQWVGIKGRESGGGWIYLLPPRKFRPGEGVMIPIDNPNIISLQLYAHDVDGMNWGNDAIVEYDWDMDKVVNFICRLTPKMRIPNWYYDNGPGS